MQYKQTTKLRPKNWNLVAIAVVDVAAVLVIRQKTLQKQTETEAKEAEEEETKRKSISLSLLPHTYATIQAIPQWFLFHLIRAPFVCVSFRSYV